MMAAKSRRFMTGGMPPASSFLAAPQSTNLPRTGAGSEYFQYPTTSARGTAAHTSTVRGGGLLAGAGGVNGSPTDDGAGAAAPRVTKSQAAVQSVVEQLEDHLNQLTSEHKKAGYLFTPIPKPDKARRLAQEYNAAAESRLVEELESAIGVFPPASTMYLYGGASTIGGSAVYPPPLPPGHGASTMGMFSTNVGGSVPLSRGHAAESRARATTQPPATAAPAEGAPSSEAAGGHGGDDVGGAPSTVTPGQGEAAAFGGGYAPDSGPVLPGIKVPRTSSNFLRLTSGGLGASTPASQLPPRQGRGGQSQSSPTDQQQGMIPRLSSSEMRKSDSDVLPPAVGAIGGVALQAGGGPGGFDEALFMDRMVRHYIASADPSKRQWFLRELGSEVMARHGGGSSGGVDVVGEGGPSSQLGGAEGGCPAGELMPESSPGGSTSGLTRRTGVAPDQGRDMWAAYRQENLAKQAGQNDRQA